MKHETSEEEAIVDHWSLHYIFKELFRGFIKAGYRIIHKKVEEYPNSIYGWETKCFWKAMDRIAEDTGDKGSGNGLIYCHARDVICCLAESQDFYRKEFARFTRYFGEELKKRDGDDYLNWGEKSS